MEFEEIDREQIEALRQQNIGRLFLRASRAYSELALTKLQAYGHEGLRQYHARLIANLDIDGTRITVLAERADVSKQAMGQMVADLEKRAYIERVPDPTDGRAVLIKFTPRGWQFLQDAHRVKKEIEAAYTAVLGQEQMQQLRTILEQLLQTAPR